MRRDEFDFDRLREARGKLTRAFRELRKKNIRARANFMCCGGCASSAIDIKGKRGGVWWHQQDDSGFREDGQLYIGFSTKDGKGSLAIGKDLAQSLKDQGLDVEWDGDSGTRVLVYAEGARKK